MAKEDLFGDYKCCASYPFPELRESIDASMDATKNGLLFCSIWGFKHVYAVQSKMVQKSIKCLRYRVPEQIKRFTIGKGAEKELLFGTFYDRTVRVFSIGTDGLIEMAHNNLSNYPHSLLWLPQRQLLLAAEWDPHKESHKVSVFQYKDKGHILQRTGTALDVDASLIIWCWQQKNDDSLMVFDGRRRELVEFIIQDN